MIELKPILTKASQKEYDAIMAEAMAALMNGDDDAYDGILLRAPISPGQADELKHSIGIQGMVKEGLNLSWAVEVYGEDWLRS